MKKKEKSLAKLNRNALEKLSLKDGERMVRKLDKDRDNYIYIQSCTMLKHESKSNEENIKQVSERFRERLADEELTVDTIDRVFNELITDAYLDRGIAYCLSVDKCFSEMEKIQAIRQKADNHLVRLIRAFVDIKRPLIKVFVRRLDQLNVSDKQVNISQKNTNDLDKNNEKIS